MTETREQALDRLTDWAEPVETLKPPKNPGPKKGPPAQRKPQTA